MVNMLLQKHLKFYSCFPYKEVDLVLLYESSSYSTIVRAYQTVLNLKGLH